MRVIIVTGASSGIGRGFAEALGARKDLDEIWVIARRRERLVRHVVAVRHEHEVGLPVPHRLHEPRVHHLRADVPHEAERREEARHVALRERGHLPLVAYRPRRKAHVDPRAPVTPVAHEEVSDKKDARRLPVGGNRCFSHAHDYTTIPPGTELWYNLPHEKIGFSISVRRGGRSRRR